MIIMFIICIIMLLFVITSAPRGAFGAAAGRPAAPGAVAALAGEQQ